MKPTRMPKRRSSASFGWVLGCLTVIVPFCCEAQVNLIPNHSFEERDTCREMNDVYYPDNGPVGWFSAAGTPDHFISCLQSGSFNGVPLNAWSFQYPQEGECYGGVLTYREIPADVREYFMIQLLEPLMVGQRYYASFYASGGWGGNVPNPTLYLATNGIGVVFTMEPRQWELNDPYLTPLNYAHVSSEAIITDTVGWTLVSGSFVADSAYRYAMLGNHFDNANTDTLHFATFPWMPAGYVLIDNVCVSMDPDGCPLVAGIRTPGDEELRLYPNPAQQWIMIDGIQPSAKLEVCDVLGRNVWQGKAPEKGFRLDVSTWARGTYMLHTELLMKRQSFKFVLTE